MRVALRRRAANGSLIRHQESASAIAPARAWLISSWLGGEHFRLEGCSGAKRQDSVLWRIGGSTGSTGSPPRLCFPAWRRLGRYRHRSCEGTRWEPFPIWALYGVMERRKLDVLTDHRRHCSSTRAWREAAEAAAGEELKGVTTPPLFCQNYLVSNLVWSPNTNYITGFPTS